MSLTQGGAAQPEYDQFQNEGVAGCAAFSCQLGSGCGCQGTSNDSSLQLKTLRLILVMVSSESRDFSLPRLSLLYLVP